MFSNYKTVSSEQLKYFQDLGSITHAILLFLIPGLFSFAFMNILSFFPPDLGLFFVKRTFSWILIHVGTIAQFLHSHAFISKLHVQVVAISSFIKYSAFKCYQFFPFFVESALCQKCSIEDSWSHIFFFVSAPRLFWLPAQSGLTVVKVVDCFVLQYCFFFSFSISQLGSKRMQSSESLTTMAASFCF